MDYATVFAMSAAGMGVERTRLEVAALNLANAHALREPGTPGFQPLRVIVDAAEGASAAPRFADRVESGLAPGLPGLPSARVLPSGAAPRLRHEPGHPWADAQGFVASPGVDPAAEMVQLMSATRAYEANVAVMNAARTLALRALQIGGGTA